MEEKTITEKFERDYISSITELLKKDEYRENIAFITVFIDKNNRAGRSWNIPGYMAPSILGALEFTKLEIMDASIFTEDKKSEEYANPDTIDEHDIFL